MTTTTANPQPLFYFFVPSSGVCVHQTHFLTFFELIMGELFLFILWLSVAGRFLGFAVVDWLFGKY